MNPDKRAREEDNHVNQDAKRQKYSNGGKSTPMQDEKISKVFSGFMSDYLKLNWVNEDKNPHIPPKYVLTDMIMEKFFKEANWRDVCTANEVVEYMNRCLSFHGMSQLGANEFPQAYAAWKACFSKDFNSMELESAEVLCQLKKVLSHGRKEDVKPAGNTVESEEMKSDDAVPMFTPATKMNEELKVSPTVPVETPPVVSPNPPEARVDRPQTSKYVGVYFDKEKSRWRARLGHKGKEYAIGSFSNELDAARAVNAKCIELGVQLRNPDVPGDLTSKHIKLEVVNDTNSRMNYTSNPYAIPPQNRFPPQTHQTHYHSQMYQTHHARFVTQRTPARYEILEEKQVRFNPKKNLFDLTVLIKGQWHNLGSFDTHQDAVTSWKILRTVSNLYSNNQATQPHQYTVNQMPQNMPSAPIPSSMQHESTIVVYKLPTQKVIQLIHRLPSINLSDPWQLTQLVCLYLCLFARISIKMLCSLREPHLNVNTINPNSIGGADVKKPFVTVVVGHPMCIKHLKCMCSEAHDMCNVLCVVTVLTLYQNQKNDTGPSDNQVFVRGIALAPDGISRCLTQTPLRETNKLQLAQWLKKITSRFTH